MDKLEKFIHDHRDDFDCEVPPMRVWHHLQQQLDDAETPARSMPARPHRRLLYHWMSMAAAAVVLLFAGAYFGANYFANEPAPIGSMAEISPEHGQMEQYYQKEVREKQARLVNYDYDEIVVEDLEQLDAVYNELKKEISKAPEAARKQLVEAMIENYQARISILERVLERLETTQTDKSTQDEINI